MKRTVLIQCQLNIGSLLPALVSSLCFVDDFIQCDVLQIGQVTEM